MPAAKKSQTAGGVAKQKKKASAYNQFMSKQIKAIKAKNGNLNHREVFAQAAAAWTKQKSSTCGNKK